MTRSTIFLTADQLVALHAALLERFGGEEGGGHRGAGYEGAEAAVQAVKNSYYDDVHELAAAYAVYIVQGHVFLDGNKRRRRCDARLPGAQLRLGTCLERPHRGRDDRASATQRSG